MKDKISDEFIECEVSVEMFATINQWHIGFMSWQLFMSLYM